jgi:hypothetical protein
VATKGLEVEKTRDLTCAHREVDLDVLEAASTTAVVVGDH